MNKRCVDNQYIIEIVSGQEGLRLYVLKGPCAVYGDCPRKLIPGHAAVIVLET